MEGVFHLNPFGEIETREENPEDKLAGGKLEDGITREESRDATKTMKRGSEGIVDWLYLFFSVGWNGGRVPNDWCKATICKIFK